MVSSKEVLRERLQDSARLLEWAISRVPPDRVLEVPPHDQHPNVGDRYKTYFGEWSAYRLFFHVVFYEEVFALPTMKHWLGVPYPEVDIIDPDFSLERAAWQEELERGPDLPALVQGFRQVRIEQIRVLEMIPAAEWDLEKVNTGLGPVSADFVVAKTIQHTLDHGNALLRNALYWERAWDWLERQG
jgi:hypothetical protein